MSINELKSLSKALMSYYQHLPTETMEDIEFCIEVQSVIDEIDGEILERSAPIVVAQ